MGRPGPWGEHLSHVAEDRGFELPEAQEQLYRGRGTHTVWTYVGAGTGRQVVDSLAITVLLIYKTGQKGLCWDDCPTPGVLWGRALRQVDS
ncbi:hypothetical protein NDU88_004391 [Pleurodeles waltl]|uniref:Uncharacterized protein n=1 Tax=Pleurodeles waltl TaxID=8319 RepID=A0AAV7SIR2_PLEWA|nr:hypothetical protein NDU88_004391 [Pleurodeles waltl]